MSIIRIEITSTNSGDVELLIVEQLDDCDEFVCPAATAERRIVEWLRAIADYGACLVPDDDRPANVDPHWVVDPTDVRDLADAIERGEHREAAQG